MFIKLEQIGFDRVEWESPRILHVNIDHIVSFWDSVEHEYEDVTAMCIRNYESLLLIKGAVSELSCKIPEGL